MTVYESMTEHANEYREIAKNAQNELSCNFYTDKAEWLEKLARELTPDEASRFITD